MKPLKLTVQGFGPFADRHEIDFGRVSAAPLFGFYGTTGSGKTSVLDAICFALFGESSGGERDRETLRSDYASPEQDSFVSLVFSVGPKSYFIHRIPEYEKKKLRGEGTTQQKHEAWLFDVSGIDPQDIDLVNNPGALLAERKVKNVQEKVSGILGYNASQFRQVVMLPQGKFRDFLTANSKSRSEILRQLFDMSLYERLEDSLKQRGKFLKDELSTVSSERDGVLLASGLETIEDVRKQRETMAGELTGLKTSIEAQDKVIVQAVQGLEKARKLNELFTKLEQARAAQKRLDLQQDQIRQDEARVARCKKAMVMGAAAEKLFHARAEKLTSEQKLLEMQNQRKTKAHEFQKLDEAFQQSMARQAQRDGYEATVLQAGQFMEVLAAQLPLQQELAAALREKQDREKQTAKLEAQLEGAEKQLKQAAEASQQLKTDQMQQVSLENAVLLLKAQLGQYDKWQDKQGQFATVSGRLDQAKQDWEVAQKTFRETDERFRVLEQHFHASQAAILAQGLEQGLPCPVCGGADHPAPARLDSTQEGLGEAAFKQARGQWEAASKNQYQAANDLKQLETRFAELGKECAALEGELQSFMGGKADIGSLKQKLSDEMQLLQGLEKSITQGMRLAGEYGALEKQQQELAERLARFRQLLEEVSGSYIRKQAQANAALQGIPEELQQQETLEKYFKDAKEKRDQSVADHERVTAARQQGSIGLGSLQEQEKSLLASHEVRIAAFGCADQEFTAQLALQGFATEQDYLDALLQAEILQELEDRITSYGQQKKVVEEQLERYNALIAGQEMPAITSLEKVAAQEQEARNGLQKLFTGLEGDCDRLKQTEKHYQEKTAAFEKLDQQYRRAQTLSDIANGAGDNQRKIRLVDWLLSSYFDDVLAQANLRFTKMTNQQFRLHRKLEKGKGRGVSGLDIEVYDDWSGKSRPSVSLSGGESFLAALALALGLADVVQQESGGVVLEAIFIDEGFGHLDEEALDQALNILTDLSGKNRTVGIISHVEEVKRRVPAGFDIIPSPSGSRIVPRNH